MRVSSRKKLLLIIGISCLPCTTFGMEPETLEEDRDENTVTSKLINPQAQLSLPSSEPNNAAASTKASLPFTKQNLSFKYKFNNFFKSNETQLNEKILLFDNNIKSTFKQMKEYATAKKPSEYIETLRLNFCLHMDKRKIIDNDGQEKKFNTNTKELIDALNNLKSTESLLDQLWSPCPVSLTLTTANHLHKIGEKALKLITFSAYFLFEITKHCTSTEEENEEEFGHKIAIEKTTVQPSKMSEKLLDSLCVCYPELSKRLPTKNEYLYYSAKYLTLKGHYTEAWPFLFKCTKLQEHMNGNFTEEIKWTKQLRSGYLSEGMKKNNHKPLDAAEYYLEIAKVTEKINIIKNNTCEESDFEAGSYYLKSAECFYQHNPEQAFKTIKGWDLNILYPLAYVASEHLQGSSQNEDALKAIRTCSLQLLNEAADRNESDAQFSLGKIYEEGLGVLVNRDDAFKWYSLANEQDHKEAAEGMKRTQPIANTQKDEPEEKDEKLYQWSLVYDMLSDPDTAFQCGLMYFLGKNFPQSFERAVICFFKAAEFGHIDALFNLGKIYEIGISGHVPRDDKKAATYYLSAAGLGHVNAQYTIALMYEEGRGVPKNTGQAVIWFKKSADNKNIDAQVKLFFLSNVLPDHQKALDLCLEQAENADLRDPNAQYRLGLILQSIGDEKSLVRAAKHYYEAAKQGHPLAQYSLGLIFERIGNQKFLNKAIIVYRLAAKQGHLGAQIRLKELIGKGS